MRRNMRLLATIAFVALGLLVSCRLRVSAETASAPSLVISQVKITSSSGQFVTLYNTTGSPLDMSRYQLQYFNSYDLTKATSSRLIPLTGTLPPHGYYMVNDSALRLCYQLMVDSVSLGLSSTAGMVQVLAFHQAAAGAAINPVLQDYVAWSKTTATGAQTLPANNTNAFLQRQPVDGQYNPSISSPGSGSWQSVQPDAANPCELVSATGVPTPVLTGLSSLLPSSEPPATIIGADGSVEFTSSAAIPAGNIGLMVPQVTELLPNPDGTGNDATDEYIELYNPNAVSFDLSGYALESGTTSTRSYTFPAGTHLPAKAFKAFYPDATKLSLSNTSGQVKLIMALGSNSLSASESYSKAKDGQAWALAKGKWYWTTSPTPNAANVIKQPPPAKKAATKKITSKSKAGSKAKGAKTPKTKNIVAAAFSEDEAGTTPINYRVLAIVAGLALLYGAYEYRTDMANRIRQLRRHFEARRGNRS